MQLVRRGKFSQDTQTPAWQLVPLAHTVPQAPQLPLSVCSSTQDVPQAVVPVAQGAQTPAWQLVPSAHTFPHSLVLTTKARQVGTFARS